MIRKIPNEIKEILLTLSGNGYEAYLVGGCVRDILMDRNPNDFDIASNAMPEDIIRIFGEDKTCPTGIKYGTVTVFTNNMSAEITHYRSDGTYSDFRTPDNVTFVSDIHSDLLRRDFTINAMALSADGKLIDDFGGIGHISERMISCVGKPQQRFSEDALRILRAVRFASELDFEISPETSNALIEFSPNLEKISAERIRNELNRIICGKNCGDVLKRYSDVFSVFIPEIKKSIGFEQHSPYHKYNVWEHTAEAVSASVCNLTIRLTMLLHDVAKPLVFYSDETGRGHFKGHDKLGSEIAGDILKRLKYEKKTISDVTSLIYYHSVKVKNVTDIKKLLSKLGERLFFMLFDVKRADNSAKNDFVLVELEEFEEIEKKAAEILRNNECISLSQLAVNGNDLIKIGITGKKTGEILNYLLNLVIEDKIDNSYDTLMSKAYEMVEC